MDTQADSGYVIGGRSISDVIPGAGGFCDVISIEKCICPGRNRDAGGYALEKAWIRMGGQEGQWTKTSRRNILR